ncbi:eukaryotic peptide chain release factor subunit 1-like [Penaeus chinensis]|uniref:eukaryotic peptide chain release factor subunit 1-like n=1 Tax=Penaeus chinensis TaxID=139456 RepID=UPI001FB81705|nr:eukaryotic peptide chain release factor subunit 1-like [Penaeus chinensis]
MQEHSGVCLKNSDVDELRARFVGPKEHKARDLVATSLDVLQVLQGRKPLQNHIYGYVVLMGDHHTIARGTFRAYEILHDKSVRIANRHGRGGQSQNRFARLAEETRVQHLNLVLDRMAEAFFDGEGRCSVEKIVVGGPGPMKQQLLEHLPEKWAEAVDQNPVTVDHTSALGMHELVQLLEERCALVSKVELQRQRQRMRKEGRKDQKGQQRGGGRKERQEKANERRKREEEEEERLREERERALQEHLERRKGKKRQN